MRTSAPMPAKKKAPATPARNTSREGQTSVLLWLPSEHLDALDAEAAARSMDRTALLRELVAEHVGARCQACQGTGRKAR